MPQRRQDAKNHKELIFNDLHYIQLCAFVPSCLRAFVAKKYFSEQAQLLKY